MRICSVWTKRKVKNLLKKGMVISLHPAAVAATVTPAVPAARTAVAHPAAVPHPPALQTLIHLMNLVMRKRRQSKSEKHYPIGD